MAHKITGLCLRDGSCIEVCPVDCIVGGHPENEWPRMYIDPDTCIDCGACVPECPYEAIFMEDEVPDEYVAVGGEYINRIGFNETFETENVQGEVIKINSVRKLDVGEIVDLTEDVEDNAAFFETGPGYDA